MSLESLRSLVTLEPTHETWNALLESLDLARLRRESVEVDYVAEHTAQWPLELRILGGDHVPWPLKSAPALWPLAGVLSLRDRRIKVADLATFLASPLMDGIEGLDLSYNKLGVDGVEALITSGRLRQLRYLDLSCCMIGDAGAMALAGSPDLASVTRLALRNNKIKSKGAKAFFRSPHLRGLTWLDYARNSFGAAGGKAISANPAVNGLRHFDLDTTGVGDGGLKQLAGSRVLRMLESLNLASNKLGEKAAGFLQTATWARSVRRLDLSENPDADLFGALTRGSFANLQEVDLTGRGYASPELSALGATPWVPSLQVLTIGAPKQAGVSRLATAHNFTGLRSLRLHGAVLTVNQVRKLLDARGLRRLMDLRVMGIRLGTLSEPGLASIRGLHRLSRLSPAFSDEGDPEDFRRDLEAADLSGVTRFEFPSFAADAAAQGLAANPTAGDLEELTMDGYTDGSDAALEAIGTSPHLTGLRYLRLAGRGITDAGVEALAASPNLGNLRRLELFNKSLGVDAAEALATASLGSLTSLRLEGPEMGYEAWDKLRGGAPATWRAFLMTQTVKGSTGDFNRDLKGMLGYARHRGIQGATRLRRMSLVHTLGHPG